MGVEGLVHVEFVGRVELQEFERFVERAEVGLEFVVELGLRKRVLLWRYVTQIVRCFR